MKVIEPPTESTLIKKKWKADTVSVAIQEDVFHQIVQEMQKRKMTAGGRILDVWEDDDEEDYGDREDGYF